MALTKDDINKVAKLANLKITSGEEDVYFRQLSEVLEYVGQLDKTDTGGVEPTFDVTPNINVICEDVPSESLSQEDALKNALVTRNGFFVTKGIFEDE